MVQVPMSANGDPEISIVLPCKNEEPTIGEAISKVRQAFEGRRTEIIVPDSSDDNTPEIAREMGAKIVKPVSLGYGCAYREGFNHCGGSIIAMADPDGTYDLAELPSLVSPLEKGDADFVMGNRFSGNMDPGAMSLLKKKVGNPFLTWVLNFLFGVGISDAHCGMRALTQEAFSSMELRTTGMEFASEMLVEAKRLDLRIVEIPISYHAREGSPTKLNALRDGWRHLKYMLGARFSNHS